MRSTHPLAVCFLIAMFTAAAPASAQVTQKGWFCPADKMHEDCNGQAACDTSWQAHINTYHQSGTPPPPPSHFYMPMSILGAGVGGLVGSATSNDNTTNINNALMFGGGAMALGAVVDTRKLPPAGAGLLAGIGAAAATVGRGRTLEARGEREPAQTMKEAVVVGSTAAVLTFGLGAIKPKLAPGLHSPSGLRIAGGPRNLWMRWVW